ncbi:MAG: hypothetical protein H8E34_06255 [Bacteroidetes bacterium]|nr:hypothetical protein [Bacteroidota bacterium]MBL6944716.1 hypothetical protein [Bacteroidales bacterium]
MKLTILGFMAIAILVFLSCEKENKQMTDTQLIEAIQKAGNKQNIDAAELPSASISILEQDYSESYVDDAKLAPELGYEVDMIRERGSYIGERSQAYFDLRGRELRIEKGDKDRKECFDFVYPVNYTMPDGTTVTGNNEREVTAAIKAWYEANPGSNERPTIQYPVEVNFKGRILNINNDEEMRRVKSACDGEKIRCFVLVYPLTYIMPDGSTITGNNKEEIGIAMRNWYSLNPGVDEKPALQYPVDTKWKDGTVKTINNEGEMRRAKAACK